MANQVGRGSDYIVYYLDLFILKREGGRNEVLNPCDLVLLIFLESLQKLCLEVLHGHHVILMLLLAKCLDRCGDDVALIEVGDDAHLF